MHIAVDGINAAGNLHSACSTAEQHLGVPRRMTHVQRRVTVHIGGDGLLPQRTRALGFMSDRAQARKKKLLFEKTFLDVLRQPCFALLTVLRLCRPDSQPRRRRSLSQAAGGRLLHAGSRSFATSASCACFVSRLVTASSAVAPCLVLLLLPLR